MVDFLLQTHDLNHDGLLDPSELLSPSVIHQQVLDTQIYQHQALVAFKHSLVVCAVTLFNTACHQAPISRTPQQEQELPAEKVPSNSRTEEENVVEHREEAAREELRPQVDDQAQQEVITEKDEPIKQADQHSEQEKHKAPAGEWQQVQDIPLHQGQPEI